MTPTVIATVNGQLTGEQQLWAAVLNGGHGALLGGLHAAELARLKNWHRDEIEVLVPRHAEPPDLAGTRYIRSRRRLGPMQSGGRGVPRLRIEPAILLWASQQRHLETARGVVHATVQQRLSQPSTLLDWLDRLAPLRHGRHLRDSLEAAAGGAHSNAERYVRDMCRRFGLASPHQQRKRHDATGRARYTDAEWRLADGRTLILEVDGAFHLEVGHWEEDIARQRALTSPLVTIVRCTALEAKEGSGVARDLVRLGVPRVA